MDNIPVNLGGYKLIVSEEPAMKMRENKETGEMVPVTDRQGVTAFVVSLFAKPIPAPGALPRKGEEIRVTLSTDPGEGFEEGMRVELINPRVSAYQLRTEDGRELAGVSLKATGMVPAGAGVDMNAVVTRHSGGGEK
jgi:hypothetical protein